jgi:hypothetical protein
MKTLSLIAAFMLGTTTLAQAGPFGLPDHQQNGFRDTGCDEDQRVQVPGTNYFNNPSCRSVGGGGTFQTLVDAFEAKRAAEEEDDETPVVDAPVDPEPEAPCKTCAPEAS